MNAAVLTKGTPSPQFHASTVMLGYCLAATCVGEMCTSKLFTYLLENNSRDPVIIAVREEKSAALANDVKSRIRFWEKLINRKKLYTCSCALNMVEYVKCD